MAAADDLLPLFHDSSASRNQQDPMAMPMNFAAGEESDLLTELFGEGSDNGIAVDEMLAMLEATPPLPPHHSPPNNPHHLIHASPSPPPPLTNSTITTTSYQSLAANPNPTTFDLLPASTPSHRHHHHPSSPSATSDGYLSDCSGGTTYANNNSPKSAVGTGRGSHCSPNCLDLPYSYNDVMGVAEDILLPDSSTTTTDLSALIGMVPMATVASSTSVVDTTTDVRIDLELNSRGTATDPTGSFHRSSSPSSCGSPGEGGGGEGEGGGGGKATTLVLSEEEKKMLSEEGIFIPTDMPLTKSEQKNLKRVRRKIKNKVSAQESRKRKKDYVDGLEKRVEMCSKINRTLQRKVETLEGENKSLYTQLKNLQSFVARYNTTPVQAGACLLVVALSFSIFFLPGMKKHPQSGSLSTAPPSRALLFTETDRYGNLIDPETGRVVSEHETGEWATGRGGGGGLGKTSPTASPPWGHAHTSRAPRTTNIEELPSKRDSEAEGLEEGSISTRSSDNNKYNDDDTGEGTNGGKANSGEDREGRGVSDDSDREEGSVSDEGSNGFRGPQKHHQFQEQDSATRPGKESENRDYRTYQRRLDL